MKSTAARLEQIISEHLPALHQLTNEAWLYKPAPDKWSRKEILGHLADSAHSNIRRFVVAQYEDNRYPLQPGPMGGDQSLPAMAGR